MTRVSRAAASINAKDFRTVNEHRSLSLESHENADVNRFFSL